MEDEKTKIFIEKAKKIHGNKYDYTKTKYVNSQTKVCIICPEHGEFWQTPNVHLDKHGCAKCRDKKISEENRYTTEQFIEKAKTIHGDKYDYSKVVYCGNEIKVCIMCPEHGEFWQTPHSHLSGRGCKKCGVEERTKKRTLSTEEFIKRAKEIHGDKYDYSKTEYININEKVCIICHEKDEFGVEHGKFWQRAEDHLKGFGCRKCSKMYMDTETFINRSKMIHENKYDYTKTKYVNRQTKVCIICPEHGEFWQDVSHHMNGHGCPKCNQSVLENDIIKLLENNNIEYLYNKRYKFLNNLQLDFYIPKFKVAIECQGIQHFKSIDYFGGEKRFQKTFDNDEKKLKLCEKTGIKLFYYSNLHIKYPYKVFENKEDLLKNILNEA